MYEDGYCHKSFKRIHVSWYTFIKISNYNSSLLAIEKEIDWAIIVSVTLPIKISGCKQAQDARRKWNITDWNVYSRSSLKAYYKSQIVGET